MPSTAQSIEDAVQRIRVWTRGDQRAPHKPLLLLHALARCAAGKPRLVAFRDVEAELRELLRTFGPPRRSLHPEYPFWRLRNDGLWELAISSPLRLRQGQTDALKSDLRAVEGGFPIAIYETLRSRPKLLRRVARALLDKSFPESLHADICEAVGLDLRGSSNRRYRDPAFRSDVLRAYDFRCAICGFDLRMGALSVGVEAAHVKWVQAGGPDKTHNGIALCILHHKLFDLGAFTVTQQLELVLSDQASGTCGFAEHLLGFHGKPVARPKHPAEALDVEFLDWHRREVFRGPPRYLEGKN